MLVKILIYNNRLNSFNIKSQTYNKFDDISIIRISLQKAMMISIYLINNIQNYRIVEPNLLRLLIDYFWQILINYITAFLKMLLQ